MVTDDRSASSSPQQTTTTNSQGPAPASTTVLFLDPFGPARAQPVASAPPTRSATPSCRRRGPPCSPPAPRAPRNRSRSGNSGSGRISSPAATFSTYRQCATTPDRDGHRRRIRRRGGGALQLGRPHPGRSDHRRRFRAGRARLGGNRVPSVGTRTPALTGNTRHPGRHGLDRPLRVRYRTFLPPRPSRLRPAPPLNPMIPISRDPEPVFSRTKRGSCIVSLSSHLENRRNPVRDFLYTSFPKYLPVVRKANAKLRGTDTIRPTG